MTDFNKDEKGSWIAKDPSAVLDYSMDWSQWLQVGETLAVATWSVTAGIVKVSETNGNTVATVWLSGGSASKEYVINCHILTTSGREDERSFRIRVKNR